VRDKRPGVKPRMFFEIVEVVAQRIGGSKFRLKRRKPQTCAVSTVEIETYGS
jgi:hypothetical protein